MNAVFLTENLIKKLSFAQKAISPRTQLPILSCFLLRAHGETLDIIATDLEIGIQTEIKGNILKEGEVCVPARVLFDLISNLPSGEVEIKLVDNNLEIKTNKTQSVIQTQPIEDFPSLFENKGEKILSLSRAEFKEKISRVIFSTATETARPILEGILFEKKENSINIVSTDGYRLSIDKIENINNEKSLKIVIPTKITREALNLEGDTVDIYHAIDNNQLIFSSNEDYIVGRVIEGEFPNYGKIIPDNHTSEIKFLRSDFQKAVKNAAVFARDASSAIKLQLYKNSLKITSRTASVGETSFEIEANLVGEENEIAFNPRFLSDALSNIDSEEIIFQMTGPLNAGSFRIKEDPNYLHLIMPIRM